MQHDRTRAAVSRQLKGMGASLYEVGIRHAERGMLNREWSEADIMKSLDWLKRENFKGCDIYVRPARSAPSRLILVDDLSMGTLARLQAGPYPAAVTVQTSPGNYQAWIKLDDDMPADVRREVARHLAREYGGDPNSADSAHYGRLAGFTNRKPEHIDAAGRSPFVLLDSYNGRPASGAAELVQIARGVIEREREQARSMAAHVQREARNMPQGATRTPQTAQELAEWYRSLWHSLKTQFGGDFDASRADWMAAVAMFRKGYALTAGKAEIWHELKAQGADYADVADALLSLAQDRAQNRP